MAPLRLHFCDFSSDFVPVHDFFFKILSRDHDLVIDPTAPDFLIYSCYGSEFLTFDCPRIFYTAENIRPDFNLCDYAIGFDFLEFGDRYLRFPNFARYAEFPQLVRQPALTSRDFHKKSRFCNFIYSNAHADPVRDQFFTVLSRYKAVDSAGRHLNNARNQCADRYDPGWRASKVEFQRSFKFTIAFENSSSPGYTTEKIMHAFLARTIPIYWGNPLVARDFNPEAFINCHDYQTLDAVVERVAELEKNDGLCLDVLNAPCFVGNTIPHHLREGAILAFLKPILAKPPHHAFRRPLFGATKAYERNMRLFARSQKKRSVVTKMRTRIVQIMGALVSKGVKEKRG